MAERVDRDILALMGLTELGDRKMGSPPALSPPRSERPKLRLIRGGKDAHRK